MRSLKTVTLILFLAGTLPMFGASYIKFDGVDGESTAAGHEKWIEILSMQNADGTPVAGMLSQGRVRLSTSSGVTQLGPLCQSRRPLGNVLVDLDGVRHVLRNARFVECPTLRGGVATSVLEFGTPATAALSTQRGNASISGLARTPLSMDIRRASITGNVATVALKGGTVSETLGKAIMEATAKGTVFPMLVIESAGQQWSFTKAMFTSANYSPTQDTMFTLQFESMTGSAAAFQALGN